MRNAMKMAMMRNMGGAENNYNRMENRYEMRGEMENNYNYSPENAFRDRRGRRHYDNGRFAPKSEMESEAFDPPYMYNTFQGKEVRGFQADNVVDFPRVGEMENKTSPTERGKGSGKQTHLDRQTIERWLGQMKNTDGSKGPHWSMEQVKHLMSQNGISQDPIMFWATINMMYSDYCEVAQKYGLNNEGYYIDLAEAFLDDEDVNGDKLSKYYFGVVKG